MTLINLNTLAAPRAATKASLLSAVLITLAPEAAAGAEIPKKGSTS